MIAVVETVVADMKTGGTLGAGGEENMEVKGQWRNIKISTHLFSTHTCTYI